MQESEQEVKKVVSLVQFFWDSTHCIQSPLSFEFLVENNKYGSWVTSYQIPVVLNFLITLVTMAKFLD